MSTTNELITLFKSTKEFTPIDKTGEKTPTKNDYKKNQVVNRNEGIKRLHTFIPILTSRVFVTYERNLRKYIAYAPITTSLKNRQTSKLTSEVNTLIKQEKSINAPLMKSIIMEKVVNAVMKSKQQKINPLEPKLTGSAETSS